MHIYIYIWENPCGFILSYVYIHVYEYIHIYTYVYIYIWKYGNKPADIS